jgi:hypothetical protein
LHHLGVEVAVLGHSVPAFALTNKFKVNPEKTHLGVRGNENVCGEKRDIFSILGKLKKYL